MTNFSLPSASAALAILLLSSVCVLPMQFDTLFGLTLLGVVAAGLRSGHLARVQRTGVLPLLITGFLLYLSLSLFWSDDWRATDAVQVGLRTLLCFCFLIAVADASAEQTRFLIPLTRLLALSAFTGAVICAVLWWVDTPDDGRMAGLFRLNNPSKLGRTYAAISLLLTAALFVEKGRWRAFTATALIASIAVVLLSGTRSAWLGAVVGLATLLIAQHVQRPAQVIRYLGLFALPTLLALLIIALNGDWEFTQALLPRQDSMRFQIWQLHLDAYVNGPLLFGQGFLVEYSIVERGQVIYGAHSMYLSTLLQSGLLGLILFIAALSLIGTRLLLNLEQPLAKVAFSLLVAGAVMFVFNGDRLIDKLNTVWFVVWFPAAVALSAAPKKALQSEARANTAL